MPNNDLVTKLSYLVSRPVRYARFRKPQSSHRWAVVAMRAQPVSAIWLVCRAAAHRFRIGSGGRSRSSSRSRRSSYPEPPVRRRRFSLHNEAARRSPSSPAQFHRVGAPPHELPFATAAFDAAWTTFALARLGPETQERVLAEMHRVVRPGGILIALERVPDTVGRRWHASLTEMPFPSGARNYRSAEDWRAVLARNGWHLQTERCFDGIFRQSTCRALVCRRL